MLIAERQDPKELTKKERGREGQGEGQGREGGRGEEVGWGRGLS